MKKQTDCYVGFAKCGCLVAWANDCAERPEDSANAVAEFIRDGLRVEPAITEEIRDLLGPCKCKKGDKCA